MNRIGCSHDQKSWLAFLPYLPGRACSMAFHPLTLLRDTTCD
jgi:hypothetical protein